ncbi:ATP-grasp domain-containing protein [Kitasatospora sp. NPDC092039]|uniref:preATP grasp domain-containing protein n=1 Tax=Kitasatospora sp. NPDC092039 TaxID=3364086 RepID=UPI00381C454F
MGAHPGPPATDFAGRLSLALTGSPDARFLFLGNFEVEQQWALGEHTLPRLSAAASSAVVNRMDEFALLLAGGRDHVVLKTRPDRDYLGYLAGLGLELPRVHVPAVQDPQRTVTEDALADPALLAALAGLAAEGCRIAVHGVSEPEERLAAATGLPLAGPDAATCKAVNSKVYSRRIADELGLRQPRGWACETLAELAAAFAAVDAELGDGRAVVKEAFGVSGKGIARLTSRRRGERILGLVAKQVEGSGRERIAMVVEEWVDKVADLNYQFTVGLDGSVAFDFVKEQLTEDGVHKGHRMPARLTAAQVDELRTAADRLGKRLAADGFHGVVGVDAMVDPDGGLYPVVEINARNNMSTYQVRLQERFVKPGQVAVARHYPLRLTEPLAFDELRRLLDGLLLDPAAGRGLLVNNFATVNAAFTGGGAPVDGRLYGIVVADSAEELTTIDAQIAVRLDGRERGDRP